MKNEDGLVKRTLMERYPMKARAAVTLAREGTPGAGTPGSWRGKKDPSLAPSEGAWPCQHLDFGLVASRTVKEKTCVLVSPSGCGDLFQQPRERNTNTTEVSILMSRTGPRRSRSMGPGALCHHSWSLVFLAYMKCEALRLN